MGKTSFSLERDHIFLDIAIKFEMLEHKRKFSYNKENAFVISEVSPSQSFLLFSA